MDKSSNVKIKMSKRSIILCASVILSLLFMLFTGFKIKTQDLTPLLKTYSGGLPFTWIEFYYEDNASIGLVDIMNKSVNFSIDGFLLFVDIIIIQAFLIKSIEIITKIKAKHPYIKRQ